MVKNNKPYIIDFGFSIEIKDLQKDKQNVGTYIFMPCYVVENNNFYSEKIDFYSLGIILYSINEDNYYFKKQLVYFDNHFDKNIDYTKLDNKTEFKLLSFKKNNDHYMKRDPSLV